MTNPDQLQKEATHIVLLAWISMYVSGREPRAATTAAGLSAQFESQAQRLRESAIALQIALEKMRAANEKLALRMAEHKAFFAKYKTPE